MDAIEAKSVSALIPKIPSVAASVLGSRSSWSSFLSFGFHEFRQAANRALRCNQAGSNALLRFSMTDDMMADPGFFHLLSVVWTFRRVCGRSPRILDCWPLWMRSFDGHMLSGPFVVLLDTLNKLGWRVPPLIHDRIGLVHDLLLAPWKCFRQLLEDAWMGRSRSSAASLHSVDIHISKWHSAKLTPHARSLQSALQSASDLRHGREW